MEALAIFDSRAPSLLTHRCSGHEIKQGRTRHALAWAPCHVCATARNGSSDGLDREQHATRAQTSWP
eukprot:5793132-Alexandrium_andersonii.AAC.1